MRAQSNAPTPTTKNSAANAHEMLKVVLLPVANFCMGKLLSKGIGLDWSLKPTYTLFAFLHSHSNITRRLSIDD